MKELSWQAILQAQQQDFIQRLKHSLSLYPPEGDVVTLSCLDSNQFCKVSYHSERIKISFDEEQEVEIDNFCWEQADKFNDGYEPDAYMNCKIGKIGEEAVKIYLYDLITGVNYEISNHGDGGLDFSLKNNKNIGIQVKTKTLSRVTYTHICQHDLSYDDVIYAKIDLSESEADRVDDVRWSINQKEIAQNQVLICVLLMNFIEADKIEGNSYDCIIAGFKPTAEIKSARDLKMQDLLYIGGIRPFLESLS
jgi:hypothetical protein